MKIDISDIITSVNKKKMVEASIDMETFDMQLGNFPIVAKSPFELTIANRENKELLLNGDVAISLEMPCDRCLEPVTTQVAFSIDKKLTVTDGVACDDEMEETDYLIGFELDVDKLIYSEVLVNWPMKVLCKEDCKGICKKCGANLNAGTCNCETFVPDPRMAAFQDIFSKFKEV